MSNQTTENNKRIAKNSIMLYLRMFLTMVVGAIYIKSSASNSWC